MNRCLCGNINTPNPTNMCVNCIRTQVDITEGIQKQVTILWCKNCGRYLQPPKHWLKAELGASPPPPQGHAQGDRRSFPGSLAASLRTPACASSGLGLAAAGCVDAKGT